MRTQKCYDHGCVTEMGDCGFGAEFGFDSL
jgi:hypothetical protein